MGKNKNTSLECRAELKKHTCIIHSSNELSLLQRKISNVLLFHAYHVLLEQEEHKISINELCKYLGYSGHNYDALKNALKALISTVLEWNLTDDTKKEEDWTASSILASVNIKGAVCSYAYSPRMRKLLYSPSMYGRINLSIQSNFTSSYGLALYENCIRYRNLSKTKLFSLEVFRKLMGVPNGKYLVFADFKKRVINKAVEEINTLSDIFITPYIEKVGQKVCGISFGVTSREKKKVLRPSFDAVAGKDLSEQEPNKKETELRFQMINVYEISSVTAEELIRDHGTTKIFEKISMIEKSQNFINGKIKNLAGFLIDAIKSDYKEPASSLKILDEKRKETDRVDAIKKVKKKTEEEMQQKYSDYVDSKIVEVLGSLTSQQLFEEVNSEFEKYLCKKQNKMVYKNYKESGFNDRIVRIFLNVFLKENYPYLLKNIDPFEVFAQNSTLFV